MADLQYNITQLQQCLDVTVGTPSVGDVVTVTSTSPLAFDLAPSGGGSGTVDSIVPEDPITVNSSDPANPIVGVKEADGSANQAGIVTDKNQVFNGKKTFLDIPRTEGMPTDPDGWQLTNKKYVDTIAAGLSVRAAVRAATLVAGTLSSSFENGDIIDGVTLATNNRILIKNQTNEIENGIYTVNASGAPTRAADYNGSGEANAGSFTTVTEGSQANTQWVQLNATPTPGTNPLTFSRLNISAAVSSIQSPNTSHGAGGTLTGAVSLDTTDIYYSGNSGDDLKTRLDLKAPLDSPALTGTPTATTASQGNNSTRIATTAYVDTGLVGKQTSSTSLTNLAALTGTAGFAVKTGTNTWSLDTTSYATTSALTSGLAGKENLINLTANKAVISNGSGALTTSTVTNTEIGYVSGVTSSIQTQIDSKANRLMTVSGETGTTYTYAAGDQNEKYKRFSNATTITVYLPADGTFAVGTQLYGIQAGLGQVVINASGFTINSANGALKTRTQYSSFTLIKVAANTWDLIGDITV